MEPKLIDNVFAWSRIRETAMSILWTIMIGFVAGVIAKFITAGDNERSGFLMPILGIVGAFWPRI
jgi:uncharacterized membrane protein YeaQ/YmgE (transglycosylase-associated protein family)